MSSQGAEKSAARVDAPMTLEEMAKLKPSDPVQARALLEATHGYLAPPEQADR